MCDAVFDALIDTVADAFNEVLNCFSFDCCGGDEERDWDSTRCSSSSSVPCSPVRGDATDCCYAIPTSALQEMHRHTTTTKACNSETSSSSSVDGASGDEGEEHECSSSTVGGDEGDSACWPPTPTASNHGDDESDWLLCAVRVFEGEDGNLYPIESRVVDPTHPVYKDYGVTTSADDSNYNTASFSSTEDEAEGVHDEEPAWRGMWQGSTSSSSGSGSCGMLPAAAATMADVIAAGPPAHGTTSSLCLGDTLQLLRGAAASLVPLHGSGVAHLGVQPGAFLLLPAEAHSAAAAAAAGRPLPPPTVTAAGCLGTQEGGALALPEMLPSGHPFEAPEVAWAKATRGADVAACLAPPADVFSLGAMAASALGLASGGAADAASIATAAVATRRLPAAVASGLAELVAEMTHPHPCLRPRAAAVASRLECLLEDLAASGPGAYCTPL